jgi:two-component system, NarL family, sensor histidine kinase UhpB
MEAPGAARHPVVVSLFGRVLIINAALVGAAALLLLLTPVKVSAAARASEVAVLLVGVVAVFVIGYGLLRRAFADLERLAGFMRRVDLREPGQRVPVESTTTEVADLAETFNAMLERLELERRESAGRVIAAQERERQRVALELHDEVGQSLTGLMLQIRSAADLAEPGPLRERLQEALETSREGVEAVRDIARGLRPEALDEFGLRPALIALASNLAERAQVTVRRRLPEQLPALPSDHELVVYRVAQEALTNVARHANAREVVLSAVVEPGALAVSVRDDGSGIRECDDGSGIAGMRERARLAGGTLAVGSANGGGTEVVLRLPLGA